MRRLILMAEDAEGIVLKQADCDTVPSEEQITSMKINCWYRISLWKTQDTISAVEDIDSADLTFIRDVASIDSILK